MRVITQTWLPAPVGVLFNPTNYPTAADPWLIGPGVSTGTKVLLTNGLPLLVPTQPYYLAVTNPNAYAIDFSVGVWFDITTLDNCVLTTNQVVGMAGIPRYFQFDIPTNPPAAPSQVSLWLTGARSTLTVVLSQHLPFAIDEAARAVWLAQLLSAMDDVGFPDELRLEFWNWLEAMSIHLINAPALRAQPVRYPLAEAPIALFPFMAIRRRSVMCPR